jgi:hypothetical protein
MADTAHITSVESIEAFRAALIVYLSKTRPVLEDACDEVTRTREWLRSDRRIFWEAQVRRRQNELQQAQQALFSAGLSNLRPATSAELAAVQQARRALTKAEEKLKVVKRWALDLDSRCGPLVKQLEQLRTLLGHDVPKAAIYLAQVINTLDAYTGLRPALPANEIPQGPPEAPAPLPVN